ncbi:hypothetical protein ACK3TF_001478 [Chlorella vulgaris]
MRNITVVALVLIASWTCCVARPTSIGQQLSGQQPAGTGSSPEPTTSSSPAPAPTSEPPAQSASSPPPEPTAVSGGIEPPPTEEPPSSGAGANSPPPAPNEAQAPGVSINECILLPNTNAAGDVIRADRNVKDIAKCCQECQITQGCNVFVFCPQKGGCDDGSGTGTRYPQGLCALKTQALTPGSQPAFWATGPVVPWESGYIS